MVLFLGVCKALKAMHQYRVKEGPGGADSLGKANRVRKEAARADKDAEERVEMTAGKKRGKGMNRDDMEQEEVEAEPLMEDEVAMSQEGIAPGGMRAYAHRDIKPGRYNQYEGS